MYNACFVCFFLIYTIESYLNYGRKIIRGYKRYFKYMTVFMNLECHGPKIKLYTIDTCFPQSKGSGMFNYNAV